MDQPKYGKKMYEKHYFHDDFDEILPKLASSCPRDEAHMAADAAARAREK